MLEMFLCVLEEELQIEVNPQRAPIARMCRIINKLESLTRSAELHVHPTTEQSGACTHARKYRLPSGRLFCPQCDDYI
jgi:hypothetical protein